MPSKDEIDAARRTVVELLGACAVSPDDVQTGRAADDALRNLDRLLTADAADHSATLELMTLSQRDTDRKDRRMAITPVPVPATPELIEDLRRVCAETLGIPLDMVTAEADLTADLGVDSLTRDDFLIVVLWRYGMPTWANSIAARSYPTIGALADLIQRLNDKRNGGKKQLVR
jgi:acyl carrier protein